MSAAERVPASDIIDRNRSRGAIGYTRVTSFDARMLTVQDELTLLARARQLDPEALALIHETYYTSIFRYVAFRVGDHATAEDLTSEVFTRLLTALRDKNAPQNTLRGWLYGVAARVVSDHHRQDLPRPAGGTGRIVGQRRSRSGRHRGTETDAGNVAARHAGID